MSRVAAWPAVSAGTSRIRPIGEFRPEADN